MAFNLVFSVLALSAVVLARPEGPGRRGGPGGPHGGPPHGNPGGPPFLANVSVEARKAFEEVFRNENLTLSEVDTQVAALAEKYGVADIYKEFQANVTAHLAEVKQKQTDVISKLSSIASQLETIFANKDQTRKAQHEAVEALRKENPIEVDAIQFIRSQLEGGQKGPHGGAGGFGGPKGGPKGSNEGSQEGSSEDSASQE